MNRLYTTQNELLLNNLLKYYGKNNYELLEKIIPIINGQSLTSIRIIDWFVTNYAKKNFVIYNINAGGVSGNTANNGDTMESENRDVKRFKVYMDYKLKLKAYSKKRFDPFCRWDRINIPYKNNSFIQTTIGQLNFFKWALDNEILEFVENNMSIIEKDMNNYNSTAKRKLENSKSKTRKTREELSISATRSIKKENVEIIVRFN
jgi:hypothetical protein